MFAVLQISASHYEPDVATLSLVKPVLQRGPDASVPLVLVIGCHAAMQEFPEHRLQFFSLLRAITNHCFGTLFTMSPDQLKLVIDSIVWAFRHTERNIAETGNLPVNCLRFCNTVCAGRRGAPI